MSDVPEVGKKRALLVGINDYDDPNFANLKFATADALELENVLTDRAIGEFDEVVSVPLPTKRDFEIGLMGMLRKAAPEDLVLVYFAGHGVLDASGQLCLATQDTDSNFVPITSVPLENVNRMIDQSKCKSVVLLLDCCYSGSPEVGFRAGTPVAESLKRFSEAGPSGKRIVVSATESMQMAREMPALKHGVFTHYIIKGLREEADQNRDGYVSIEELFNYVRQKVPAETNNMQVPTKWGVDDRGEIRLSKHSQTLQKLEAGLVQARVAENIEKLKQIFDDTAEFPYATRIEASRLLQSQGSSLGSWERKRLEALLYMLQLAVRTEEDVTEFLQEWRRSKQSQAQKTRQVPTAGVAVTAANATPAGLEETTTTPAKAPDAGMDRSSINDPKAAQMRQDPVFSRADEVLPSTVKRDLVFISYSHEDKAFLEKLTHMLAPLVRRGLKIWSDPKIKSGANWRQEIDSALAHTSVAVLLVSSTFLSSEFIDKKELPVLLNAQKENGVTILWVLVSKCRWDLTEIEKYQSAHDTERPLVQLTSAELDDALVQITNQIEMYAFKPAVARP